MSRIAKTQNKRRCPWPGDDPLYIDYHDGEWGVPCHDDRRLFEFLVLEGAQAGLSWITILRKRDAYRQAFADFDPRAVAAFSKRDVTRLMTDDGIVRNRRKIESAINNAARFLEVQSAFGSFDAYAMAFTGGRTIHNRFAAMTQVPASTPVSEAWSRDMRRRGFTFVGPTILYAHMQACGMVNDHLTTCFRHGELKGAS